MNLVDDDSGTKPLYHAVDAGNLKLVEILLKAGAKVNVKTPDGETPMRRAAAITNPEGIAGLAKVLFPFLHSGPGSARTEARKPLKAFQQSAVPRPGEDASRLPIAMKTPPCCLSLLAVLALVVESAAQAQSPGGKPPENPPLAIQAMPDGLPALALTKQPAVFSINLTLPDGTGSLNKGFFIDRNGLALCALRYLCIKAPLRFDASDGTILATPKVQAVFPERHLAPIKFAYKPKAWLELADDRPPVGTWLALISKLRDSAPLTGPVLSHRHGSNPYEAEPSVIFSFATGRSPSLSRIFANGAPLMNATGRAVGVFEGAQPLSAQTLRFACPLNGLDKAIAAALKNPLNLKIPLSKAHHSYDSAWLDPLWNLADQAQMAGDYPLALQQTPTHPGLPARCGTLTEKGIPVSHDNWEIFRRLACWAAGMEATFR